MPPDKISEEGRMSEDVAIRTTEPVVTDPIVMPCTVTLNGTGKMCAPIVVMTMCVVVVGPHDAERPVTMLLPDEMLGVIDVAKNNSG